MSRIRVDDLHDKWLQDADYRAEYEALEGEFSFGVGPGAPRERPGEAIDPPPRALRSSDRHPAQDLLRERFPEPLTAHVRAPTVSEALPGRRYIVRARSVQTAPRELDSIAAVMNFTPRAPSSTEGTSSAPGSGSRPSRRAMICSAQSL